MLPFNATPKMEYGARAELWVANYLTQNGCPARLISRWGHPFDLLIDGPVPVPVEVKAARRRLRQVRPGYYRPEWRWHVANISQAQDHLLALVADDERGERYVYLAPSWVAFGRQGLSLSSHPRRYAGRLAAYLHNLNSVAVVAARLQRHCYPLWKDQ